MEVVVDEVGGPEEETCSLPWGWAGAPAGPVCRTCLADSAEALSWHDTVSQHGYTARIRDMLVFLNFIENEEKEEYPDSVCQNCITKLMIAYQFKLTCTDANATLASLPPPQEFPINFDNLTDLEIIQLDHGYDLPFPSLNPEAIDELNLSETEEQNENTENTQNVISKKKKPRLQKEQHFFCSICPRFYKRVSLLRDHEATHTDTRNHLCMQCGKLFHSSSSLRRHIQSHTSEPTHACTQCEKRYHSHRSLKEHIRISHTDEAYIFKCSQCEKMFTSKSTLVKHLNSHSGRRPFKCNECPKTFTRAIYLRVHQLSHTGGDRPKPHGCRQEGCEKKFPTKSALSVHVLHSHTTCRPHQCDTCNRMFATPKGLKDHKYTHTGMTVSCDICNTEFASKYALRRHKRMFKRATRKGPNSDSTIWAPFCTPG